MDYTTHDIVNAFRSARLQYIRADESDEALKKFIPQIIDDPLIQVMSSPNALQPQARSSCGPYLKSVCDSLLGVAIALLPEEDGSKDQVADGEAAKPNAKSPVFIGIMCLGWGGIRPSIAHHRTAEVGISLAKPYQDKGYGGEALNWVLDWGFKHVGMHSIGISASSYNPKAIHLYEKVGFTLEGRRRQRIWQNRKWYDLIDLGITEEEWEKMRGLTAA
ncbi:acyl-CoA N-acyltransferase [Dactylonectria estremocensis]|uniref:Acyl-CoA N-acyltransferase n=1 Tax=Dactylonectria estremocensis TaxID=1079267 RepID=A0A9P9DPW1_9HYPO|nr:acyl-CoA N-acyltransferase [Dactylonectria estremocensis]